MVRITTTRRNLLVKTLIEKLEEGQTDDQLQTYLLRTQTYALPTVYSLIREAHMRSAALTVHKGVTSNKVERSKQKGGGDTA